MNKLVIRLLFLILSVVCCFFEAKSQAYTLDKDVGVKTYAPGEVIDPINGIHIYDALIFATGGDSVRYDKKGYNVQGWIEDHYTDGSLLHKGFYIDGQLKVFKNYYPNGVVERSFRVIDTKRADIVVYYQDGKTRAEIFYFKQAAQKETDYYQNGNIEYYEENQQDMEYLYKRNEFFESGQPQIVFEISDKKERLYSKKEYLSNGKLKEEGGMKFHGDLNDYLKEGDWKYYDETGKVTKTEKYTNGQVID
ncbi:MAG TPA: hypothetical protein VNX68_00575 [Nitrosopumilaceae archaeon]|jgi:antitoxin component YwqK of YwqJK toxin-antitoxin module|nr:hypothetical protein [Nitrosopumilaceae archaeon]